MMVVIWIVVSNEAMQDLNITVFVLTIICYITYTQYPSLFPHFSLPFGMNVKSKWGYALANELTELKRVRYPHKSVPYKRSIQLIKNGVISTTYEILNDEAFWDEIYEYQGIIPVTAAVLAQMNGHPVIVKWLAKQGAVVHKNVDITMLKVPSQFEMEQMQNKFRFAHKGDLEALRTIDANFWDQPYGDNFILNMDEEYARALNMARNNYAIPVTLSAIAVVRGYKDMVQWLEAKGATSHLINSVERKKDLFQMPNFKKHDRFYFALQGDLAALKRIDVRSLQPVKQRANVICTIRDEKQFWDEPYVFVDNVPITPAVLAESRGNQDIVEWLEIKGAISQKNVNSGDIYKLINTEYERNRALSEDLEV